jgi:hypothetical protein
MRELAAGSALIAICGSSLSLRCFTGDRLAGWAPVFDGFLGVMIFSPSINGDLCHYPNARFRVQVGNFTIDGELKNGK